MGGYYWCFKQCNVVHGLEDGFVSALIYNQQKFGKTQHL